MKTLENLQVGDEVWIKGVIANIDKSDYPINVAISGEYIAWDGADTYEKVLNTRVTNSWKYAIPIPEPQKVVLSRAEIAEKLNIDVELLEITD